MTTAAAGRVLVCRVEADAHTASRLRALGDRSGAFTVDAGTSVPDVLVFAITDDDGSKLGELRRVTRDAPAVRTVVIGAGTGRFAAAFEAGADAWIDHGAYDDRVVGAVTGRHPVVSAGRRRRRGRRRFPRTSLALGGT
ncbi:MAG: hypothetical protein WEB03_16540 [Nitriliruptor sp.]|uniref:hypothetical protein n=1 Tax=Nitriliruptor sp. TaxID=2448056 RepID=UPI0034A098E5